MSDTTDLIRSVDEHHQACCPDVTEDCECLGCGEKWPCEVRRVRDALADSADYRMAREANAAAIEAMNERDKAQCWAEWFMAAYDYTVRHADLFGYGDFRVTTWAYRRVIDALEKHRARADEAEAAIREALEIADRGAWSEYHRFYDMVEILDNYLKEAKA